MNAEEIQTKEQAIRFVGLVLCTPIMMNSPSFKDAMTLCERYDITAKELLEYRRHRARNI